jgi:hypothetical protein
MSSINVQLCISNAVVCCILLEAANIPFENIFCPIKPEGKQILLKRFVCITDGKNLRINFSCFYECRRVNC